MRAEILPALESIQPGASARLAALARLAAQADGALVGELEPRLDAQLELADGGVWFDDDTLADLDDARRARALLAIASRAGLDSDLTQAHLERIEAFLRHATPGLALSLPHGFALHRARSRLWLGPAPGPQLPAPIRLQLPAEGELEFPERGLRLSWHACTAPDPPDRLLRLPARPLEALVARTPRADDRIFVRGRERRLKDLFASARWERVAQARALIVERGGEIVWVPGLARGEKGTDEACSHELRAVRLPSPPRSC